VLTKKIRNKNLMSLNGVKQKKHTKSKPDMRMTTYGESREAGSRVEEPGPPLSTAFCI
jgi:hypothetical protein